MILWGKIYFKLYINNQNSKVKIDKIYWLSCYRRVYSINIEGRWIDLYRIGLFSQITKTTIKTLRYYDSIGLLKPKRIDKFTGYRYYTTEQINDMYQILSYKQLGLSIKEIKSLHNWRMWLSMV